MAKYEIERKFSFPEDPCNILPFINKENTYFKEGHIIEQWYLVATDDAQVRVSHIHEQEGSRYTLNIKNGNGLKRKEIKIDLTYKDFLTLISQCDNIKPIIKHFYVFLIPNGRELELNKVDDSWWYAEVEFDSEEEANKFNIYDYFTCRVADETGNPEFMMKNYWRTSRLGEKLF